MASSFTFPPSSTTPSFASPMSEAKPTEIELDKAPSLKCLALHKLAKLKEDEVIKSYPVEKDDEIESQSGLTSKQKLLAYTFRDETDYLKYRKVLDIFSEFYKSSEFLNEEGKIVDPKIFSKLKFEELRIDEKLRTDEELRKELKYKELLNDIAQTIRIANAFFKDDIYVSDFFVNHGYSDKSIVYGGKKRSREIEDEMPDSDETTKLALRREQLLGSFAHRKNFLNAAKNGDLETLKELSTFLKPASFETSFSQDDYDEFIRGESEAFKKQKIDFEDKSFDLNFFFPSPLHLAVLNNHVEVIEYLVKTMGFNVNYQSGYSVNGGFMTPLVLSIIEGNIKAFDKLIELGANVNAMFEQLEIDKSKEAFLDELAFDISEDGCCVSFFLNEIVSPLLLACLYKDEYMILRLLRTKKVNFKNFDDYKPPQDIIIRGDWSNMYPSEILSNFFALIFIINSCSSEVIETFFESGADIDFANFIYYRYVDTFDESSFDIPMNPVILAAECKRKDAIEILLKNGANINAQMPEGETVLHRQCESIDVSLEMIKFLINSGADVNITDFHRVHSLDESMKFFKETPLMYLCRNIARNNVQECARWLIENREKLGIDINAKDALGRTVLMKTVKRYIKMVSDIDESEDKEKLSSVEAFIKFLCEDCRADASIRNSSGQTIFDMIDNAAEKCKFEEAKSQLMNLKKYFK